MLRPTVLISFTIGYLTLIVENPFKPPEAVINFILTPDFSNLMTWGWGLSFFMTSSSEANLFPLCLWRYLKQGTNFR